MPFAHSEPLARTETSVKTAPTTRTIETLVAMWPTPTSGETIPPGVITGEYVNRYFPKKCSRLLIKGDSQSFFMESAAYEAVDTGICLIGTDADSVGKSGNQIKPHKAFLQNGVAILENLDLSKVEPGDYYLVALPVKMGAIDGAPVRAVLIDDYILWNKI